jgi:acyl transferase domain-containing protein/acyl-CoA synthetase (AMP-forming)/AMP-acid ligase II
LHIGPLNKSSADGAASDQTLVHRLQRHAIQQPDKVAYIYLVDGENQEQAITFGQLQTRAAAIAHRIVAEGGAGKPLLILCPSGIEFIVAFLGALSAAAIAVPLYPPHRRRPDERLTAVIRDCEPRLVLTTQELMRDMQDYVEHTPTLGMRTWISTKMVASEPAALEGAAPEDIAFLQYTSGSTGSPKGVMVSHANLVANQRVIANCFGNNDDTVAVGWLPLFHDMGLVGNTLHPLYLGVTSIFMAPAHFLQSPLRWLRAISKYRGSISGGPNFAYDLCVTRIPEESRKELDLSCWEVAFNGAEPVRAATLERFERAFASCGFRRSAWMPCYGMAESTLLVAGGVRSQSAVSLTVDSLALQQRRVQPTLSHAGNTVTAISCGRPAQDEEVVIVDPEGKLESEGGKVGEIWVASPSVALGYWRRVALTEETFHATLPTRPGHFLRSGDLGFLWHEELYIAGRIKDIIILRGQNHYPQDIERTIEATHPAFRADCSAAFAIHVENEEALGVALEVERQYVRRLDADGFMKLLQRAVFADHGLRIQSVWFLRPGTIPKTSSGKIQRGRCKSLLEEGSLDVVAFRGSAHRRHDTLSPAAAVPKPTALEAGTAGLDLARVEQQSVRQWLAQRLAARVGIRPEELSASKPLAEYGLDSVAAIEIAGELQGWLGISLAPTLLYDCPTLDSLVNRVCHPSAATPASTQDVADRTYTDGVAIIGLSCRFPGADGADAYWQLLRQGLESITDVPAGRWDANAFYDARPLIQGKMNSRRGGFLPRVDEFDASFFGIAPRDASCMDPQQRLLLEVAWEALENAGLPSATLRGSSTGVFIGLCHSDYATFVGDGATAWDPRWTTGNALSIAANRISYLLDLRGPSLAVDTACSSSLVAVHLACQSLNRGESTLALAGGVNLILKPDITISFSNAGGTSPEGRCRPFDAGANGIVRSEGVGVVVLKPLARAIADGDAVYAVIRGSAVNQDGLTNGLTAPNSAAQEAVIRAALAAADRSPVHLQYVEAHGAGTQLGDPIEAFALGRVLATNESAQAERRICRIGSVKGNLGHTEAAAGIASLIKVALSLHHGWLPASLHFEQPNTHIPFEKLGLRVQSEGNPWPSSETPRLAGVSAFGFGGTNAHVVLEDTPKAAPNTSGNESSKRNLRLLLLSARSAGALLDLSESHLRRLKQSGIEEQDIGDLCASAALFRDHHDYRLALSFRTREELAQQLTAFRAGQTLAGMAISSGVNRARSPKVAFVFSGHRSQPWALCREFLAHQPVFAQVIARCDAQAQFHAKWSILERLTNPGPGVSPLDVEFYHPCQFAYQVAMAALWDSLGVIPDVVIGHSFGEVAAAHVAGALDLADAVKVVVRRSQLLQRAARNSQNAGGMVTVEMPRAELRKLIDERGLDVAVAVSNSETSTILSGTRESVGELVPFLKSKGVFCSVLDVPGAGHGRHIDVTDLADQLAGLRPNALRTSMVSTVTGRAIAGTELGPAYWMRNVTEPVLFADAMAQVVEHGCTACIEIAPYPPMLAHAVSQAGRTHRTTMCALPVLRRNASEDLHLADSLAQLYALGATLAYQRMYPDVGRRFSLPTYPWQRQSFWMPAAGTGSVTVAAGGHPLLRERLDLATDADRHIWTIPLGLHRPAYLSDYVVHGEVILPMTVYLELAWAASESIFSGRLIRIDQFAIERALPLTGEHHLQLHLVRHGTEASVSFFSRRAAPGTEASWTRHAVASLRLIDWEARTGDTQSLLKLPLEGNAVPLSAEQHYARLRECGFEYGPAFKGLRQLWRLDDSTLGRIQTSEAARESGYHFHPAVLDACLHVLASARSVCAGESAPLGPCLPAGAGQIDVHAWPAPGEPLWSQAVVRNVEDHGASTVAGDVEIFDDKGCLLLRITGVTESSRLAPQKLSRKDMDSLPLPDRQECLTRYLCEQLARTLGVAVEEVGAERPVNLMGIDSIMAMEMKNRVEHEFAIAIPTVRFLEGASLRDIAGFIVEEMTHQAPAESGTASLSNEANQTSLDNAHAARLLARIDTLSDDEVDALLLTMDSNGKT